MSFLKYSNETQSNIIPKQDFEALIQEVFGVISKHLEKSLGPLGSHTTILDGMYTSSTKDGFSIFKSFRFHNRYKNMIYNLIKVPCTKLNNTVGDGTTTAIVLTNHLFQHYKVNRNTLDQLYRLPRTFINIWDETIEDLVEKIEGYSKPITADDYDMIYNIAYVTSNGNHEISLNIANTYKESGTAVIKQKDSPTNKSYITPITGFEFPANLIDSGYVRSEDLSVEEKDIHVMIFDHKIEADLCEKLIIPMNEVLRAQGKKLLILAPFYDAYLCNTTLKQYMNMEYQKFRQLNLVLAQYTIGKLDPNQLTDLATVLRTWVINQDISVEIQKQFTEMGPDVFIENVQEDEEFPFYRMIGISNSALLSCTNGSIFRIKDIESDERYIDVLRAAKKELADILAVTDSEKQSYSAKIYEANARISQLEMKNYIYYIGADSALQKNITWDSVEDVIKCVRSSIKFGVIPGCQLSIIRASMELMNELSGGRQAEDLNTDEKLRMGILELIQNSVISLYLTILHGPEGRGILKMIPLWEHVKEEGIDDLKKEINKKASEILEASINSYQVFDLETLKLSDKIITSAETDINVLLAASELVKLLISGNQCLFLDVELNDSHDETVQAYV